MGLSEEVAFELKPEQYQGAGYGQLLEKIHLNM